MADNPKKRGTPDSKRVSLTEPHEVKYWTKKLDVTSTQLRNAVNTVGSSVAKVRAHLKGK